jgi:hypothetical protein
MSHRDFGITIHNTIYIEPFAKVLHYLAALGITHFSKCTLYHVCDVLHAYMVPNATRSPTCFFLILGYNIGCSGGKMLFVPAALFQTASSPRGRSEEGRSRLIWGRSPWSGTSRSAIFILFILLIYSYSCLTIVCVPLYPPT